MSWYSYYDDREQKEELRRKIAREGKLKVLAAPQKNRKLANTFWGKAWCDQLESHSDYEYRLPRGRSYLRQGNVYNLSIEAGTVSATVAGSSLYEVAVTINPLASDDWQQIKDDCAGQVGSLLDLLGGKLGDDVLRTITDLERGLFPKPREMRFVCSCPDYADMCKHVAAVLYGVGVMLDNSPDLFFVLRSVDPSELLSAATEESLSAAGGTDAALADEDLSALFGISLDSAALPEPVNQKAARSKRSEPIPSTKKRGAAQRPPAKKASAIKTPVKRPSAKEAAAAKTMVAKKTPGKKVPAKSSLAKKRAPKPVAGRKSKGAS